MASGHEPAAGLRELARLLATSSRILAFTGAGLSTGSGIPDFRGPQGLWKRRRPVYFEDFLASEAARVEHWDYKLEGWEGFRDARPNAAHLALVELERMGRLEAVVTQNVDGLHQAAGHDPAKVIELHGTNRAVECIQCGVRTDPEPAFEEFRRTRRCPRCPCGGFLKTATVSFGQPVPREVLEAAFSAAGRADLVLALGSTLEVQPAAVVPLEAQARGVPFVIVNQGPTAHDGLAVLRLDGDVTSILPAAVERMKD